MSSERKLHDEGQTALRQLMLVWLEFERKLGSVPIVARLERGTFTREDYLRLLFNLRAQVVEGARWITRAASSFDADHLDVRSSVIGHAKAEHRDYELIESDFVSAGGSLEEIRRAPRNVGTEALHAFLMQQASQPNPIDMLGAMFVVEGLGEKMASRWAARIRELLGVGEDATRFLSYHGANDDAHLEKLHAMLDTAHVNTETVPRIVKTARVVARLYALQLEEIDVV